jgi:hypothetical protein
MARSSKRERPLGGVCTFGGVQVVERDVREDREGMEMAVVLVVRMRRRVVKVVMESIVLKSVA